MSVTAWSPGFSHLRTTHLHLYSYLDGYHSILSWTLLSEDDISLSVLLPNSTASSLGSHLGTTASSPFGLSPRHHSIISWALMNMPCQPPLGSYLCDATCSLGLSPGAFTVSRVCPFAAFSAHPPPLFP